MSEHKRPMTLKEIADAEYERPVDALVSQYVYLVQSYDPCECEVQCMCQNPCIDSVWLDKEKAELKAKSLFQGLVSKMRVSG